MIAAPYPPGCARKVAEARANGLRPAQTVVVDFTGRFNCSNPMVYAGPAKRYRWDWLRGLQVVVIVDQTVQIGTALTDIHTAEPAQIDVIDPVRRLGWLINTVSPRVESVRWPRAWVDDWLADGEMFRDLEKISTEAQFRENSLQLAKQPTTVA